MAVLRNLIPVTIVVSLLYICVFAGGNALGLLGPDEPRYASIARAMAETGDWVTPRLDGQPWFEKPVLYYWTAAISFKLFGVSDAAARLPSAVAAMLAIFGMAWLAYRITARAAFEAAFLTAIVLPSAVAVIGFGRAATTDMLFSALLALALVCASEVIWQPLPGARRPGWHVAWGAALGLAALAKGPAAIALAGGSVALWALTSGRVRDSFRLTNPVSVATFAIVALPWYVLCALRNPEFLQVFLISHNLERFLTPVFQHQQPFWYFAPILVLGLVPWTALLALGASELTEVFRVRRWKESRGFFVLCWVIFPFVFFSISKSKLPGYILPAVLPLAMLAARALARAVEERPVLACLAAAAVGITFLVLAVSATLWQKKLPTEAISKLGEGAQLGRWMFTLGASGAAIAWLALRRRFWTAILLSAVVIGGLTLGLLRVGARLDVDLSARATAGAITHWKADSRKVSLHMVHRAWEYGLNYYLHRALPAWSPATPPDHLVVVSDEGLLDLLRHGYDVRVAQRMNKRAILVYAERAAH